MRYLTPILAVVLLSGCTLFQALAPNAADATREKVRDALGAYCAQSQAVRAENRAWVNENSPHTIEVTCEGDLVPAS